MPPPQAKSQQQQQPTDKKEMITDINFPLIGCDLSQEFELQRQDTSPIVVNVRGYEPATQRDRGGSRAGLSKYIPSQLNPAVGNMQIQDLNTLISTTEAELLTQFGPSLSNTGGAIELPFFNFIWVPLYGSGVQLNNNVGPTNPQQNAFMGFITTSSSGKFSINLEPQPGGGTITAQLLSGSGTFAIGTGTLAVKSKGTYYFQPPQFAY